MVEHRTSRSLSWWLIDNKLSYQTCKGGIKSAWLCYSFLSSKKLWISQDQILSTVNVRSTNDKDNDGTTRECIRLPANKSGVLSRHREELLDRYQRLKLQMRNLKRKWKKESYSMLFTWDFTARNCLFCNQFIETKATFPNPDYDVLQVLSLANKWIYLRQVQVSLKYT